ncbi:MAG: hypothetical protein QY314_00805 [Candidatus Dojkabacteria bacterium]|nr:MAG: hypothetical protein QY314_00805 [Candidatus Dojkabacteria bacterium]
MPKDAPSTYEGLSGIFDALFTTAEDSARKTKNPNSAPVLFLYSDAFEKALPVVAAQAGAFYNVGELAERAATKWINQGSQLGNSTVITISTSPGFSTAVTDSSGKQMDVRNFEVGKNDIEINANLDNAINYFKDPSSFSEKIANKWLENWQQTKSMKFWGGVGDSFQDAALYITGRKAGIEGDVASFVMDVKRDAGLFAEERAKRDVFNPLNADSNKAIRQGAAEDRRDGVYAQAFAMIGGVTDKGQRAQVASEIERALGQMKDPDRGTKHQQYNFNSGAHEGKRMTVANIFSGDSTDPAREATRMAEARLSLANLFASVSDPGVQANLNAWLYSTGPGGFEDFVKTAAKGTKAGGKSEGQMAEYAIAKLSEAYRNNGDTEMASKLVGYAATARGLDGKMTWSEQYYYTRSRWQNFTKNVPGAFTMLGFVRGDTFRVLAEASGRYGMSATSQAQYLQMLANNSGGGLGNMEGWYKTKDGKIVPRSIDALGGRFGGMEIDKFNVIANDFVLSKDANAMQKMFYRLHVYHPWQIAQGFLNGSLFQRMLVSGTNFGNFKIDPATGKPFGIFDKDAKGKNVYGWQTRLAARMMNNKAYQRFVKFNRYAQYVARAPQLLVSKGIERVTSLTKQAMKFVLNKAMAAIMALLKRLGLEVLKKGLKMLLTALTNVVGIAYTVLNVVSFGMLDKLVGKALKVVIDIMVVIIVGSIIMLMICCNGAYQDMIDPGLQSANSSTEFIPDEFYNPEGVALPDFATYTPVINNPIDPSTYAQFQEGDCPWSRSFSCGQGPYGGYSHGCSNFTGKQPAVDISPSGGDGIYAPVDGYMIRRGDYNCGGAGGPSIGNFFEFISATGGVTYGFMHSTPLKPVSSSTLIPKGTLIGAMTRNVPKSQCWTGPHIHAYIKQGASTVDAQIGFMAMCGSFTCSIGDTSRGSCR